MTPEKHYDHRDYNPEVGGVNFKLRSLAQHPDYLEALAMFHLQTGPGFLRHYDETEWKALVEQFTEYQFMMVSDNDLHGAAVTLPMYWDGAAESLPTTINAVIMRAIGCCQRKEKVNTLVVLALVSDARHHGNGWKTEFLTTLKHLASEKGFTFVLAAVRPNRKCEYPLMPFGQYVGWRQADGAPFDPNLRAHWNLGAVFLGVMLRALTIEGKVKEWERLTGMRFTESGEYIVDGAQRPVIIDQANNLGYYTDPHIWVLHVI